MATREINTCVHLELNATNQDLLVRAVLCRRVLSLSSTTTAYSVPAADLGVWYMYRPSDRAPRPQSLSAVPEVVRRESVLWKLWLDLDGPNKVQTKSKLNGTAPPLSDLNANAADIVKV